MIAISNGMLSAIVNPLGAELWSLTDAEGRELMTDTDPRWWTGHAPLLFPFVGRSRGDTYRLDGQSYSMPPHGFARRRLFTLMERTATAALFRLESDDETRAAYPFEFALDVSFSLDRGSLLMKANVANKGEMAMPFSFGFHPAFAWPLPFSAAAHSHQIVFDLPESAPIRRVGAEAGLIVPFSDQTPDL